MSRPPIFDREFRFHRQRPRLGLFIVQRQFRPVDAQHRRGVVFVEGEGQGDEEQESGESADRAGSSVGANVSFLLFCNCLGLLNSDDRI